MNESNEPHETFISIKLAILTRKCTPNVCDVGE